MKYLIVLLLLLSACAKQDQPTGSVSPQMVNRNLPQLPVYSVVGNDNRNDYPITNTLDGNTASFMTTNTLSVGSIIWISYQVNSSLNYIDLIENHTNKYNLGDLTIQISHDSTDGINGSWLSVASLNASNHGFSSGDGTIIINQLSVTWLKLVMTYNGSGAHGVTPAFYLSEIKFF